MPTTPTYPGVYIEEIPSGVHPITGVATSIAAFVDFFRRGPMNEAVQIFSYADFERVFGGLDTRSESSYAIQQFFLNGGTQAWVVRVASAVPGNVPTRADVIALTPGAAPAQALRLFAASEGVWGNGLLAATDYGTSDPATRFNLTISEVVTRAGRAVVAREERFLNLSMQAADPRFVETIVNSESELITVDATGAAMPAPSGTATTAAITFPVTPPAAGQPLRTRVTFAYNDPGVTTDAFNANLGTTSIATIDEAAARLENAIRNINPGNQAWARATVRANGERLQIQAGLAAPNAAITFQNATAEGALPADNLTTGKLKLRPADNPSVGVAAYQLGSTIGNAAAVGSQDDGTVGTDGVPPNNLDLIGSGAVTPPTGMFALDKVDLFNILCLPRVARVDGIPDAFPTGQVAPTLTTAIAYCSNRRAFLVVDTPSNVNTVNEFKQWLATTLDGLRDKNAAVYFPRAISPDPLNEFRPRSFGASGTVAGLYSRTDATRGVWKAPAGTEAVLRNVQRLEYKLNDPENGVLNPLGINCLRTFDVYGNVCWGARTLVGADAQASEWKYVPVRRLALFLEESLYRGTKWVVFEPNDEPLWAQIRLNLGAFMHNLFRQGAFQGTTPRAAYFVKCDKETTTQTDVDNGIVNIVVGFAPLKPAEFVIIKIQQLAGQIET